MRTLSIQFLIGVSAVTASVDAVVYPACLQAAPPERPTLNHTADPRPNILPDWIYNHHEPYRLRYNRPTYHGGKAMYYVFSPTSQEAMVWKENLDEGRYEGHHCPPVYKTYYYPKPWEIINTGPRLNYSTARPLVVQPVPNATVVIPAQEGIKRADQTEEVKANGSKKLDKTSSDRVPAPE